MVNAFIRTATPEDAFALADVYQAAFPEATTTLDRERYIETLVSTHHATYVAEVASLIVGFVILETTSHSAVHSRNSIRLWQLYVIPECHGSGVATELMRVAQDHARRHKYDVIWLGVSEQNARAIAFYRKQGFEQLGQHEVGAGDQVHNDIVMSLNL